MGIAIGRIHVYVIVITRNFDIRIWSDAQTRSTFVYWRGSLSSTKGPINHCKPGNVCLGICRMFLIALLTCTSQGSEGWEICFKSFIFTGHRREGLQQDSDVQIKSDDPGSIWQRSRRVNVCASKGGM
jgi:hypothetical protein